MISQFYKDWGEVSEEFEEIKNQAFNRNLASESEAQTRFDIIDRLIKEIFQWQHGQIKVEEYDHGTKQGYVDYLLRSGDYSIVIEAKKIGASFPVPTKKKKLKLGGTILGAGEINSALLQAERYAKSKKSTLVCVTNGSCWCFYPTEYNGTKREEVYASLLFPFQDENDAEVLFNFLACQNVENNSLTELTIESPFSRENKVLHVVRDSDARIDRNNIADHIAPALDYALHAEAIIKDPAKLSTCFVSTEARTKFDSILKMHLADNKPVTVRPAKRIRRGKSEGALEQIVKNRNSVSSPPVTLIIGSVGAGKTTYLKNFELVEGSGLINAEKCHWIYIDFEEMGINGNPREFVYGKLNGYLLEEHPHNPTDYNSVIEPAYENEIAALARGPFSRIFVSNKQKFNEEITDIIKKDYEKVEPYVDKVFRYITSQSLCVIVLDNIDLYEDEKLETAVFSEAISISKKIKANILVSIRDTTFIAHRNDSIFNAFELKKLWLDPPPFKEVLSKRLSYSRKILENESADIELFNGMHLNVPDLGIFFEIVKSSLLDEKNGKFLESLETVLI